MKEKPHKTKAKAKNKKQKTKNKKRPQKTERKSDNNGRNLYITENAGRVDNARKRANGCL
jgi:hypothetical protein